MFGLSYVLIAGIFAVILAGDGHLDRLPNSLGTMGFGFGIVLLLCVLVMFRNRMQVRFVMDGEGLTSVVTDRRVAGVGGGQCHPDGGRFGAAGRIAGV